LAHGCGMTHGCIEPRSMYCRFDVIL
jgi:hypothetical protein